MEIDVYYDRSRVKTVPRVLKKPEDADFTPMAIFYNRNTAQQYLVNEMERVIYLVNDTQVFYKPTGDEKKILGYKCRGILFRDFQNVRVLAYVTTKLDENISPSGNLRLDGTVLELLTSDGYHFLATDFGEGELPPDFFDLPDYQTKTFSLSKPD